MSLRGGGTYMIVVGVVLLVLGVVAVREGAEVAATALVTFGGGALLLAPVFNRLEGSVKVGVLEMTLRAQVAEEVRSASPESLQGVLPLLRRTDVAVATVEAPASFAERRLTDLPFIRQQLQIGVIGVRLPGEEHWRAGGKISDMRLVAGAQLLVCGPPDAVDWFRGLAVADNPTLWERAGRDLS